MGLYERRSCLPHCVCAPPSVRSALLTTLHALALCGSALLCRRWPGSRAPCVCDIAHANGGSRAWSPCVFTYDLLLLQYYAQNIETLSYGRGAERPVVPGVLRTPDGVVNLRPKAMQGPRKATGLQKSPVRSPPSSAVRHPDGG